MEDRMRGWWALGWWMVACDGGAGSPDPAAPGAGDDDSAPGDPGTGTDTEPIDTGSGTGGTCVRLAGGNDRVRGPDEGLPLGAEGRTLQAWVRTRELGEQIAVSYGRPSPSQGYMLGTLDGRIHARAGSDSPAVVGETFVADDRWHHLAVAFDGRLTVLVVDGQIAGVGEIEVATLEGDLVAGNTPTGDLTAPFVGWLDEVKVFSGPRQPADIASDPDGLEAPPSSLLLWWDFEVEQDSSGPGIQIPDVSGNGRDGVTGGADGSPEFPSCR